MLRRTELFLLMMNITNWVLGKMPPIKISPWKMLPRKLPPGKNPPGKLDQGRLPRKIAPSTHHEFFCKRFLFLWEFSSVSKIYFHSINFFKWWFVYSIFFYFLFSCAHIFDFQPYHLVFFIHRQMLTNNVEQCYLVIGANCGVASVTLLDSHNTPTLWWLVQHTNKTFCSSFEKVVDKIDNHSLPQRKRAS